jgi:hypothetical protein
MLRLSDSKNLQVAMRPRSLQIDPHALADRMRLLPQVKGQRRAQMLAKLQPPSPSGRARLSRKCGREGSKRADEAERNVLLAPPRVHKHPHILRCWREKLQYAPIHMLQTP